MGINVKDLAPPASSLFTADGRELLCLGSCDIALQLGDIKRTVTVSVVKKLHRATVEHAADGQWIPVRSPSHPRLPAKMGSDAPGLHVALSAL